MPDEEVPLGITESGRLRFRSIVAPTVSLPLFVGVLEASGVCGEDAVVCDGASFGEED